jgi:hypothetical protein
MNDLAIAMIVILATGAAVSFVSFMLRQAPRRHGAGELTWSSSPAAEHSDQKLGP